MNSSVAQLVYATLQVFTFAILARSLLTWFPMSPGNSLAQALFRITEPILAPFRAILPKIGMFDLSPMVAIVVLQLAGGLVLNSAR
ncbi:MAG: YggT family protein [Dehalococcoidia bacterium]|nr:YggT family protein [Dehalococcoidia bacterium]